MSLIRLLLFMCGQLGVMLLARYFFQWILIYASQGQGSGGEVITLFSTSLVGVALLGFRAFDGFTDPIAGTLSDRWVASGRERRSLLWYTAPLPAIGLALCFMPSFEMSEGLRWLTLLVGMFVFFVGYTVYAIPYWSLTGDYSRSAEDTSRLSTLLGVGLLLATAVGFILTPLLIERLGYLWSGVVIAGVSVPLMVAPYFANPEPSSSSSNQGEELPEVNFKAVLEALKNRRFRSVLSLFAGSQMSLTVMTSAAPFIAIDLLGGSKGDVARLLGPLLGVAIPASILTPWLARKLGWERGVAYACGALSVVYLGVGALGVTLIHSPMVTAMCIFACGGPMIAMLLGLEAEAITSCASEASGEEEPAKVGVYFGVYNLVVKACNGVAIATTGILADWARSGDPFAVRLMGLSAGGMLILGLICYGVMRPKRSDERATPLSD